MCVDEEVKMLIRNSYEEAKRLLNENREILNSILRRILHHLHLFHGNF